MAVPIAKQRKYLLAASAVETTNPRQAAILGGVCVSAVEYGRLDLPTVWRTMQHLLSTFALVNVDRRRPVAAEIAMVVELFEEQLGHRFKG